MAISRLIQVSEPNHDRSAFAAEARRQSHAAAAAALDRSSDEAAVMRELEGDLEDIGTIAVS